MTVSNDTAAIFSYDETIRERFAVAAGIDEAGRGPLAGPVVAAAVILKPGLTISGLRDSKRVREKERTRLFWEVVRSSISIGIGMLEADAIDRTNILQATKMAMAISVNDLTTTPDILLIDAVNLPDLNIPQKSMVRGESESASIAAASIVAKTVRDDIMMSYHKRYPNYNFNAHKGYSTKDHMERIRLYGPCPIHRKSFKRVKDVDLPFSP